MFFPRKRFILTLICATVVVLVGSIFFALHARGDDPEPDDLPPYKATGVAKEAQLRGTAVAELTAIPHPKARPLKTDQPEPVLVLGETPIANGVLVQQTETQFIQAGIKIRNSWYQWKAKTIIRIYAGSYIKELDDGRVDTSQGVLVRREWTNGEPSGDQVYLTPIKAGPVSIIEGKEEYLILESEDGSNFIFNVETGELVQQKQSSSSK